MCGTESGNCMDICLVCELCINPRLCHFRGKGSGSEKQQESMRGKVISKSISVPAAPLILPPLPPMST